MVLICPECESSGPFHLTREYDLVFDVVERTPCPHGADGAGRVRVVRITESCEHEATIEEDGSLDWFDAAINDEARELVSDEVTCAECADTALATEVRSERGPASAEEQTQPTASCSECDAEFDVDYRIEGGIFRVVGAKL